MSALDHARLAHVAASQEAKKASLRDLARGRAAQGGVGTAGTKQPAPCCSLASLVTQGRQTVPQMASPEAGLRVLAGPEGLAGVQQQDVAGLQKGGRQECIQKV